jgi:hypothetical protein
MLTHEIARMCEKKIGLGDFPLVARRFFSRLQRLAERQGDMALVIIANVIEEAQGPQIKSRNKYFGFAVKRRLEEAGLWLPHADGPNQSAENVKQLAATIAKVADPPATAFPDQAAAELERLRLSNELLKRELAAARAQTRGGAW